MNPSPTGRRGWHRSTGCVFQKEWCDRGLVQTDQAQCPGYPEADPAGDPRRPADRAGRDRARGDRAQDPRARRPGPRRAQGLCLTAGSKSPARADNVHRVIIREARPDEYPAIGDLRVTAYQALGLLPEGSNYLDTLRGFGFGTDCAVLVATDETGSGLLGTIAIEWSDDPSSELARDETEADVRAFAVAPQGQGRGVGRSLLQAA